LVFLGLGGIAYALIEGPALGWTYPRIWVAAAVGVFALVGFPLLEARIEHPMVPLRLFRSANFVGANLTTLGLYAALYGSTFFLVLYTQNVMGYSALVAGLLLAPPPLLLLVLSPVFGKLAGRHGTRVLMTLGPLVSAVGLLLLARLQLDSSVDYELLPAMALFGLGLSATVAPLDLQPEVQERLQEIRQNPTGQIDVAVLPPELATATQEADTTAFHRAMLVSGGLAIGGSLAAAATVRKVEEKSRDDKA
jgi:MFS family permease